MFQCSVGPSRHCSKEDIVPSKILFQIDFSPGIFCSKDTCILFLFYGQKTHVTPKLYRVLWKSLAKFELVSQTHGYTKDMDTCSGLPSLEQLVPNQGEIWKPNKCGLKGKLLPYIQLGPKRAELSPWTKVFTGPKTFWTNVSFEQCLP